MEQIKEKKWWFLGAIGLMLVILMTGLVFNFSNNGKGLIEGIGKNASSKQVTVTYSYFKGGNKADAYQIALQPKKNIAVNGGTLEKGKNYLVFINADGSCSKNSEKCAYCLDPTAPLFASYSGGVSNTKDTRNLVTPNSSEFWTKLTSDQKKMISLVLLYGYPNNSKNLSSFKNYEAYIATQVLIWEVQQKYRTNFSDLPNNKTLYNEWINAKDTSAISYTNIKNAYLKIVKAASAHYAVPSFDGTTQKLTYNASNGKYEMSISDSNGVLSSMKLSNTGVCKEASCKLNGNTLTITSDKPVTGKVSFVRESNIITKGQVIEATSKKLQKAIVGVPDVPNVEATLNIGTSTGGLEIIKTSEDDQIKDIEFEITGPNNYKVTKKTDANGKISITGIAPGEYTIKEITKNDKYIENEAKTVTVDANSTASAVVAFYNTLKNNSTLKILKVDSTTGESLKGAVMALYKSEKISVGDSDSTLGKLFNIIKSAIGNAVPIDTWTTDGDVHIVDADKIEVGKYTICELTPPKGYETDDDSILPCQIIEIKDKNSQITVEFKNQPTKTTIKKTDENGKLIGGAKLQVLNSITKKVIEEWTSVEGEEKVICGLTKGVTYILREVEAPQGYQKAQDKLFVAGGSGDNVIKWDVTMKDTPTEVAISKTDITTGEELSGAKLYILDKSGIKVTEWTTIAGKVKTFQKLPVGNYKLCEEAAPDGYMISDCVDFEVKESGISKVVMTNSPIKIKVIKVDSITGESLSGAELQLIDPDKEKDNVIESWTSDGKAHEIKAKLVLGKTYVIKETKAPDGYVPGEAQFTVGNTEEIKIENTKTNIEVFKNDTVTGQPVVGAHLQLIDNNGKIVEEWDTTTESKIITNIKTGVKYTIKETKVPSGYKMQNANTEFKLSIDEVSRQITIGNIPIVHVKNTGASASTIVVVVGAVLMIAGVGALIFLKKKEG